MIAMCRPRLKGFGIDRVVEAFDEIDEPAGFRVRTTPSALA
jgi:hypothetical protein